MKLRCPIALKWIILTISSWLTLPAYSQVNDVRKGSSESTLPVVVMPSPNAATLTRNISENVDLYTGKLSIDIPLYTLKSRTIAVPISLQTTANAHRVNDIGSWVGLGWQLNAGGVITRVMKNLPDEYNAIISPTFNFTGVGYLNLKTPQYDLLDFRRFDPVMGPYAVGFSISEMKDIINKGNWNTQRDRPNIGYDLQPDEFYFNFGKYSGKFTFDQDGNILFSTGNNIRIVPTITNGKITAFEATTDDGYTYEFGNYNLNAVEETKLKVASKSLLYTYRYTGCVVPATVQTPTGETVQTVKGMYEATPYVMSYMSPNGGVDHDETAGNLMDFNHPNNQYNAEYCSYPSSWYLTKITSPNQDIVTLTYIDNGTLTYVTDRSFTQSAPDMEMVSPWEQLPCVLQPVGIFSQPFFYSLAAPVKKLLDNTFWHYPSFGDNTITTNTIELKSKRLKEIITSQGYKVSFNASIAREDLPGDKRLDEIIIENNGNYIKKYTFNYEIVQNTDNVESFSFQFRKPRYLYTVPTPGSHYGTRGVNDSRTITGVIDANMRKRMFLTSVKENGSGRSDPPAFTFEYYNKAGLPFRTSFDQDTYGFAKDNTTPPVETKLLAGVLKNITYPTGGYKEFDFQVSGNASSWNGLRIKSVKEYPAANASPIIKNYTYGNYIPTDAATASYTMPDAIFSYTHNGQTVIMPITNKTFYSRNRINPEMQTRNAAGGYSFAEVSQPDNGTYRVEFTTGGTQFPDEANNTILVSGFNGGFIRDMTSTNNIRYPFPQSNSNDWQRGLPLAEFYKDNNNKTIKSVHYEYDHTSNATGANTSIGLQVSKYRIDYGADWNWMLYGRYFFKSRWQMLKSKAERIYAANGVDYQENKVENTYAKFDIPGKTLLYLRESKLISDSRNEQTVQRFKYIDDYVPTLDTDFGFGMFQLASKNVRNAVIEKYNFLQNADGSNKRYVGGLLNKYHSNKPLLKETYDFQPASSLSSFTESSITGNTFTYDPNYKLINTFSDYDNYGNILKQIEAPDINESFIWDYDRSYPVAKIVNAGNFDIAYTSFETSSLGGWAIQTGTTNPASSGVTGNRTFSGTIKRTINTSGKYIVTAWCYPAGSTTLNGSPGTVLATKGSWHLKEWRLTMSAASEVTLAGSNIDEARLHPESAQMTTFTFQPLIGMTSQCDPNNRIVYYEYDDLQRLSTVRDQAGNIVKTMEYNFKSNNTNPTWIPTSERRCKACDANTNYTTDIQQVKQIDMNPSSSSYGTFNWIDVGKNGACAILADWQTISGPTCLTDVNGIRTGMQETIQKDMNPCSETYNTTRTLSELNYTNCPSNSPDWQPTTDYRCAPCSASPSYTSNIQQRKWVDMNPASASYLSIEWRTSGSCVANPDWQFTSTAERCQMTNNNLPTGYLEREQKDMNPCSPTAFQLRWTTTTSSPSCNPVFTTISYENIAYGFVTSADVIIRFWQDANFTIPADVSNITVNIMEEWNSDCGWSPYTSHTFTCSGTEMLLFQNTPIEYEISPGCLTHVVYYQY